MTVWGIPPCLPLGFIHLCWRPLSSPSPAPASFFRKLGSPWERVCPWGRPLGSVPCSPTDIRVGSKRGSAAPACTCASPGRRERLCGEAQEVGEGETCQNLGPGLPGRPRRSCSLQQVRRTRARSLSLSRHRLRWSRFAGGTLAIGPALRSSLRAASSALLPSPSSSQLPPALPGRGGGNPRLRIASAPPQGQLPLPAWHPPRVSTCTGGQRPPGQLLSSFGSGSVPRQRRTVPGPLWLRSPRQHRGGGQVFPGSGFPASREQRQGAGASRAPWEWVVDSMGGFRLPPEQCQGRAGEEGPSHIRASLA